MVFSFYKFFLKSKNITLSFSFYSFLFDTEVREDNDGLSYIKVADTRFYFGEKTKKSQPDSIFSLGVKTQDDLIDIKNKVNLAFYKNNLTPSIITDSETVFSFLDMDKNAWRFELM